MIFNIRTESTVPIYEQIVSQVIFNIASGAMAPGTMIPSVRDLAQRIIVNPNTVARAFQELERRGVVAARRGLGMEVTENSIAISRSQRQDIIRGRIREALREGVGSAMSPEELRHLVDEEFARANGKRKK